MDILRFLCQVTECHKAFLSVKHLIDHMKMQHGHNISLNLICSIDECSYHYNTVETFRKHVRVNHAKYWGASICPPAKKICSDPQIDVSTEVEMEENGSTKNLDGDYMLEQTGVFANNFAKHVAFLKLNAREIHRLPKSTVSHIFDGVHQLFDFYQTHVQSVISSSLNRAGVDYKNGAMLRDILSTDSFYGRVTKSISSNSQLTNYMKNYMHLVKPVQVHLDQDSCSADYFHYVPILTNIKSFLEADGVFASCVAGNKSKRSDVLYDFTDGQYWKSNQHSFNQACDLFLRIHLYTDEFEICNPLGSRKGAYKLCAFYYIIANMETKYWSSLSNIHLAILARNKLVQKHGYEKLLRKFNEDVKQLQSEGCKLKSMV